MDYLPTASPLDGLLDGGLECDAITLVFGEGGSGKTNLALQCAREVARKGRRIAYVDTEGVSSVRLRQVFSAHEPHAAVGIQQITADGGETPGQSTLDAEASVPSSEPTVDELMERVLFFTPYTIEEQERLVQNATRVPDLGLIVVDSINMHYRLHIDGAEGAEGEASRSLYKQLHHLTGFARQNQVPVLVTGQVYGGEDATQPFARRVMEHLVKALIRFEKRSDGSRRATVIKHRSIEEGRRAEFRIGMTGLEGV
ncbi:MAG: AAA family ATPase [bacterium]